MSEESTISFNNCWVSRLFVEGTLYCADAAPIQERIEYSARLFRPFSLLLGARCAHNFVSKWTDCSPKNGLQTMLSEASIFLKKQMKMNYFAWRDILCVCGGGIQWVRTWMFGWSESEEEELKLWWERSEYAPGHGIWLQLSSSDGIFGEDILRNFPNQLWCQLLGSKDDGTIYWSHQFKYKSKLKLKMVTYNTNY
jgi:hypothetical protein